MFCFIKLWLLKLKWACCFWGTLIFEVHLPVLNGNWTILDLFHLIWFYNSFLDYCACSFSAFSQFLAKLSCITDFLFLQLHLRWACHHQQIISYFPVLTTFELTIQRGGLNSEERKRVSWAKIFINLNF